MAVTGVMAAAYCGGIAGPSAAEPALLNLPTPPRDGGPVVVRAGFDLRDINEIDDEAETFEFEGVLTLEWRDERQAFDAAAEGVNEKLYQGAYQFNEVFTGWFPQVVLVNESGLYEKHGVLLRVRPDGSLRLVETVNAAAKADLDLRAYPFDRQRLEASSRCWDSTRARSCWSQPRRPTRLPLAGPRRYGSRSGTSRGSAPRSGVIPRPTPAGSGWARPS